MDLPAAPLDEPTAITSDASAAMQSPCGALQQRSVPSADDCPAATTFALEALPPDMACRILEILACPECLGTPPRLRALQPAALTCRAWRAAARRMVRQPRLKGGPDGACDRRDLSVFPQLSRLVFDSYVRGQDAAQLLLTLPAPNNSALSPAASAVSGGGSEAQTDRTDEALRQNQRASGAGGSCCSGLKEICGGDAYPKGSALHIIALPLPMPTALTSLTHLDVVLMPPGLPDDCASHPHSRRAGAPSRRLAAAIGELPLLVHLRVRDAPPVCAALAEALPRAARLRELVINVELTNFAAGCPPPRMLAASELFWAGATQLESLTVPADLPSVFERVTALTSLTVAGCQVDFGVHPACCEGLGRLALLRRLEAWPVQWQRHLAGVGLALCSRLTHIQLEDPVSCVRDNDGLLEILEGLSCLKSLDVDACFLDVSKVATLTSLTELHLLLASDEAAGSTCRLPGGFTQLSALAWLDLNLFDDHDSGAVANPTGATAGISVLSSLPALRDLDIRLSNVDRRAAPMRDLNLLTQITALSLSLNAHWEYLVVAEALPTALAGLKSLSLHVYNARLIAVPTDGGGGPKETGDKPRGGTGPAAAAIASLASLTRLKARVGSGACELLSARLLPSSLRCLSLCADDPDDEAAVAALLSARAPPAPALRRLESLELSMRLRAAAWRVPTWLLALSRTLDSVRLPGIIGQLEEMRSRVQGEITALDALARMGVREIKVEFAIKDALEVAAGRPVPRSSWVLPPPPPPPPELLTSAPEGAAGEGAAAVGAAARAFLRDWGHLLVLSESRL